MEANFRLREPVSRAHPAGKSKWESDLEAQNSPLQPPAHWRNDRFLIVDTPLEDYEPDSVRAVPRLASSMMTLDQKIETANWILEKNIAWINSADIKATILFAIDSAMLAVLAALVPPVSAWTVLAAAATSIVGLLQIVSVACLVVALFPQLKGPRGSLIYFGGVASLEESDFVRRLNNASGEEMLGEFARQCHRTAEIAQAKFVWVKWAVICGFSSLPFWIVTIWFLYPIKFAAATHP